MKLLNKKGFSLVELLAAITIMGILMMIAGAAVSIYLTKSRENAYVTMAISARQAAEEYIMEYPGNALTEDEFKKMEKKGTWDESRAVTFDTLTSLKFMSKAQDPADGSQTCSGRVFIYLNNSSANNDRALDSYSYVVHECCANHKMKYTYAQKYVNKETKELCKDDSKEECEMMEDTREEISSVWCD